MKKYYTKLLITSIVLTIAFFLILFNIPIPNESNSYNQTGQVLNKIQSDEEISDPDGYAYLVEGSIAFMADVGGALASAIFIVFIPGFFLCTIIISQAIARLIQIGNEKSWTNITSKIFTYISVIMHIFLFLILLLDFGLNIRKSNIFLVLALLLTLISIVRFIKTMKDINKLKIVKN